MNVNSLSDGCARAYPSFSCKLHYIWQSSACLNMPSCEYLVYFMCRGPLKGDPTRSEGREGVDDGFNLFSRSLSLSICLCSQSFV